MYACILAINNENLWEKKNPPFTLVPKTNKKEKKYIGINLTKFVQDLYAKSYKTLMQEIEEDLDKWRGTPYSWKINVVKMSNSLKFDL